MTGLLTANGGATINGNLHVTGNIVADGEVSSGGTGNEGTESGTARALVLDMDALNEMGSAQDVPQSTMNAIGLTDQAVSELLDAKYNKIVGKGTLRDVYSYDGFESTIYSVIYIKQGDVVDTYQSYALTKNKNNNMWNITYVEI